MKVTAAIAWDVGAPLAVEELELPDLGPDEVIPEGAPRVKYSVGPSGTSSARKYPRGQDSIARRTSDTWCGSGSTPAVDSPTNVPPSRLGAAASSSSAGSATVGTGGSAVMPGRRRASGSGPAGAASAGAHDTSRSRTAS